MKTEKIIKEVILCLTIIVIPILLVLLRLVLLRPEEAIDADELENSTTQEVSIPVLSSQVVDNSVETVDKSIQEEQEEETIDEPLYTEEELEILALIIYQEAGGDTCSDDTRFKVGNVFLNRVSSSLFPDTFYEVATQERQYGSLFWTGIEWPDRHTEPGEQHAVERAYRIAEQLLLGVRVLPDNVIWQAEFPQGDGTYCYQYGTYFCYSEVD